MKQHDTPDQRERERERERVEEKFLVIAFCMSSLCISPADDMYRVRLRPGPLPGSEYINASFVNVRTH